MLPMFILGSVVLVALGIVFIVAHRLPKRLPPVDRAEMLERIRRL